jgi:integrase
MPRKLTLSGGLTLAAARKLTSDALLDLEKGNDPSDGKKTAKQKAAKARAETVQWLCEQYLKREGNKLRTEHARRVTLERLVYPAIGDKPLVDLKRSHIVAMLDEIEDKNGAKMSDLTLAYVRRIFAWHAGRVDDFNTPIVAGMGRYDARKHQGTRVLSDDELRAIWTATEPNENTPQPFHALIRFLLLTGARRAEAREMPWSEINESNWTLPPERNKTKVELLRPLSKAAQRVLKTVPRVEGARLVFGHDGGAPMSLTKPTERLKQATGTTGWRVHDLRRSARTLLSRAGVNSDVAERCLGHVIGGVRGVYDRHHFTKEMELAYEALAALIERIADPTDTVVPLQRKKAAE